MNEPHSPSNIPGNAPRSEPNGPQDVSWDALSAQAPERPARTSNLPEITVSDRPRRVRVVLICAIAGIALWVVAIALAWSRIEEIRAVLVEALPPDVVADYGSAEIERVGAILVAIIAAAGCAVLLVLTLAARTLHAHRSGAARITLVICALFALAIGLLWVIITAPRALEWFIVCAIGAALALLTVLALTSKVTAWLRQYVPKASVPLTALRDSTLGS